MKRLKGWVTVGAISLVSTVSWFAAGRAYPQGPIGQLNRRLLSKNGSGS